MSTRFSRTRSAVPAALAALLLLPSAASAATNFVSPVQSYTCTNQVTTALAQGTGAFTCSTVTGAMFGASVAAGTVFGNNTGSAGAPAFTTAPALGVASTTAGTLALYSSATANAITLQNTGATAAYNFNLPLTAGSAGQFLASGGGGSTAMTWATALTAKYVTASKTTNYQVATATDDATRFDNTGASATVTFTLPTAANTSPGDNWCFAQVAAQIVSIAANSTQTITMGNVAGTTGTGTLQSPGTGGVGSVACLYATSSTNLIAWDSNGAWTNN